MMDFALLASGSKGNCFLLKDEGTTLQIDCGTTKKYLRECFQALHHKEEDTDALLITHDHSDHVSQIRMFQDLNIYSPIEIPDIDTFRVRSLQKFHVGNLQITPIALSHDALNTTGYIIEDGQEKLTYVTDTGYLNERYYPLIQGSDYIVMESNHDVEMLMQTRRPQYVKARIYSDQGHLNNDACAEILDAVVSENTKEIILAHISQEGNTRQKALDTVCTAMYRHHGALHQKLVISAAGQFEMIRKGENDEESDPGSVSCTVGMEHLADRTCF
jgi:phosphoribosyl 1,2-cyclic phosphodiesterase